VLSSPLLPLETVQPDPARAVDQQLKPHVKLKEKNDDPHGHLLLATYAITDIRRYSTVRHS
jgi:hypothetical protein